MKFSKVISLIFLIISVSSCVSKKEISYFQNFEEINNTLLTNYSPIIQVDDLLSISVNVTDEESAAAFNLQAEGGEKPTHLVDINGNINYPMLGEVKAIGFTTNELKNILKTKLEEFLINPIVTVRIENFRVTILGEVKSPGVYNVNGERLSIPEVIGLAGDLTLQGKRENIMLVRNINGKVKSIKLNLTDGSIFNSPYFYLAQNDILYVEPTKTKMNSSSIGATSSIISMATALISLGLILTR